MRRRIPVAANEDRNVGPKRLEMIQDAAHLQIAVALRRMGIEMERDGAKRSRGMFDVPDYGALRLMRFSAPFILSLPLGKISECTFFIGNRESRALP